jgi:hypothetical protein
MALFLINYSTLIRWQIRAQNAADGASGGTLSPIADYYNGLTMTVYAAEVDEMRLRYLDQAIVNNLTGGVSSGIGCSTQLTCDQDYDALVMAFDDARSAYVDNAFVLDLQTTQEDQAGQFDYASEGAWDAIALQANTQGSSDPAYLDCGDGDDQYKTCDAYLDPAFSYYPINIPGIKGLNGLVGSGVGIGTTNTVDSAACVDVPFVSPGFLKIGKNTFRAVGRSALGLVPTPEGPFTVSSLATSGGVAYQPNEDPVKNAGFTETGTGYIVDFSSLSLKVNFYAPGPVAPTASFNPSSFPTPSSLTSPLPCPSAAP